MGCPAWATWQVLLQWLSSTWLTWTMVSACSHKVENGGKRCDWRTSRLAVKLNPCFVEEVALSGPVITWCCQLAISLLIYGSSTTSFLQLEHHGAMQYHELYFLVNVAQVKFGVVSSLYQ